MQRITTAILAISIAAITVSFLATNSMLPTAFMIAQDTPTPKTSDSVGYLGHVIYVVKGPDGNIKSYVQTDNTRTVTGITCGLNALFFPSTYGITTGNTTCTVGRIASGGTFTGFNVIGLVNGTAGTTMTVNGSDTFATTKIGGTRTNSADGIIMTANQGQPAVGTFGGSTYQSITITSPAFGFTGDRTAGTLIRGAVLLNATSGTPTMFAENFLSPTVTVGSADTLTVTWTITLS
jgi:hypothetical protein